jgi:hypothetical protein
MGEERRGNKENKTNRNRSHLFFLTSQMPSQREKEEEDEEEEEDVLVYTYQMARRSRQLRIIGFFEAVFVAIAALLGLVYLKRRLILNSSHP